MELNFAMALPGHAPDDAATATAWDERSPDRALLAAFRAGDGRAFEALVRRHQRAVLAVALRLCRDEDAAEDLAQRAFVRALDALPELAEQASFRSWVLRIVVNLAKNHLRDHARFQPLDATLEPAEESGPEPHERLDLERRRASLRAAVEELPARQREVLLLRLDGELPFAEVARTLSITENNAKVNFHLAVKRLRSRLGDGNGEAP